MQHSAFHFRAFESRTDYLPSELDVRVGKEGRTLAQFLRSRRHPGLSPLKPINDAYCDVVNKDIKINVGGLLANWNPASHGKYWKDRNFIEPVSKFLIPFLQ